MQLILHPQLEGHTEKKREYGILHVRAKHGCECGVRNKFRASSMCMCKIGNVNMIYAPH